MNVSSIKMIIKAFILSKGLVYNLLLSKRWMYWARAVEDHETGSFTIKEKDGVCCLVKGTTTEFKLVKIVNGPSIND